MYNFDEVIDRTQTNSVKQGFRKEHGYPEDVIALWVADMDFRSPKEVCDYVTKAGEHGIFGYAGERKEYFEALHNWNLTRHHWDVKKEWVVRTPGVVTGIAIGVRTLTKEEDAVMIMQPVYHPFQHVLEVNNRKIVKNQLLIGEDGRFQIDYDKMEKQIEDEDVKMLILCSPHNPGGRVWTKEELQKVADICLRHQVFVIADEIHYDFIFDGREHTVFATLSPEVQQNCIICTAPSKTFNLAGLEISNIIIPNDTVREKFETELARVSVHAGNAIGIEACRLAYAHGAQWLDELLVYLQGNVALVRNFLQEKLPEIRMMEPDGTYLVWLDFRALNKGHEELNEFLIQKAKVWMNDGTVFGDGGEGWFRMNLGSSRSVIQKALEQLEKAIHSN